MSHRRNLDDLIKEAVHDQIQHLTPPIPSSEAWQSLNDRMNMRRPTRKYVIASSILIVFLVLVLFKPSEGFAFTKVTEIFHRIHGTVTEIFGSSADPIDPHASKAPPKGAGGFTVVNRHQLTTKHYTMEEARKMASFTIQVPARVPDGFTFSHANIMESDNEKSDDIYLIYSGNQRTFTIRETNVMEGMGLGVTVNNEDTQVSELKLNDWDASLLQFKDGSLDLFWLTPYLYNEVKGKLTVDEAKMIALSLR